MVGEPFAVAVDSVGATAVLRLAGDMGRSAAADLASAFRTAARTGASTIALDFSAVDFLNSTGIALVVGIINEARTAGLAMLGWGLSDHFREIFEITRIVDFMPIHKDEITALESGSDRRN